MNECQYFIIGRCGSYNIWSKQICSVFWSSIVFFLNLHKIYKVTFQINVIYLVHYRKIMSTRKICNHQYYHLWKVYTNWSGLGIFAWFKWRLKKRGWIKNENYIHKGLACTTFKGDRFIVILLMSKF